MSTIRKDNAIFTTPEGDSMIDDTSNAAQVTLATKIAGERIQSDDTKSYLSVATECEGTIISAQTTQTINTGLASDVRFFGVHITKALTGTCVITGFQDTTSAAKNITFPIGSVGLKEFPGILNRAGALTVTCSDVADDDNVIVLWKPTA